jgi:hypothetical protein
MGLAAGTVPAEVWVGAGVVGFVGLLWLVCVLRGVAVLYFIAFAAAVVLAVAFGYGLAVLWLGAVIVGMFAPLVVWIVGLKRLSGLEVPSTIMFAFLLAIAIFAATVYVVQQLQLPM